MSSIIEGRKPEYTHNSCRNCKAELEYLSTSVPVTVRCYSCKQNSTFETTSASKANGAGSKKLFTKRKIGSDKEPLETEYYDLLGVEPTADASEIKKQYYKLALKFHPDKNSSPEAEQKFKKISVAYQVLSDPALRKKYNEFGSGNNDVEPEGGFVNPEDFFRQQFGGDRFVDIIGEISIGRDMKEVLQNAQDEEEKMNGAITDDESSRREAKTVQDEERDRIRKERVEKLVANLIHKLSIYVETDDPEGYRKMIEMEADELKTESYGIELLHAIGFTYSLKAKQYLGGEQMLGLPRFAHIVREKGHVFTETISTLRSAIDLQQSFTQLQEAEKKGLDADEMKELEKATANKGLTALWKGSKLEVEGVLRQVCDQVLSDSRASKAELRKRAEGLKIIGHVYETAKAHDDQLGGRGQ